MTTDPYIRQRDEREAAAALIAARTEAHAQIGRELATCINEADEIDLGRVRHLILRAEAVTAPDWRPES